jgi:hypothetical protein
MTWLDRVLRRGKPVAQAPVRRAPAVPTSAEDFVRLRMQRQLENLREGVKTTSPGSALRRQMQELIADLEGELR